MIVTETKLPDKEKWAGNLRVLIAFHKVTYAWISRQLKISTPTLRKIMDGAGSHDDLKRVEEAVRKAVKEGQKRGW